MERDLAAAGVAGDVDAVRRLLAAGAPADGLLPPFGFTPLMYACFSRLAIVDPEVAVGVAAAARLLVDAGADVNVTIPGPDGRCTPLYGAAGVLNDARLTAVLLDAGADPDEGATGSEGTEALYHAAEFADTTCLRLLLEARPRPQWVAYCLGRALDFSDPDRALLFLEHGAVRPGSNALRIAVRKQAAPVVVAAMLEHGADPNATDDRGTPVLVTAVRSGQVETARLLEAGGAVPAAVAEADRNVGRAVRGEPHDAPVAGIDPFLLEQAVNRNDLVAIDRLLAAGLSVDASDEPDWSALRRACWIGNAEAARLLVAAGANVMPTEDGSPLGAAMHGSEHCFDPEGGPRESLPEEIPQSGYVAVVELLLEHGAPQPATPFGSEAVREVLGR